MCRQTSWGFSRGRSVSSDPTLRGPQAGNLKEVFLLLKAPGLFLPWRRCLLSEAEAFVAKCKYDGQAGSDEEMFSILSLLGHCSFVGFGFWRRRCVRSTHSQPNQTAQVSVPSFVTLPPVLSVAVSRSEILSSMILSSYLSSFSSSSIEHGRLLEKSGLFLLEFCCFDGNIDLLLAPKDASSGTSCLCKQRANTCQRLNSGCWLRHF